MKKLVTISISILFLGIGPIFANGNNAATTASTTNSTHKFTNEGEVVLELERSQQEVVMHILLKDMAQYDHIIIERSGDNVNSFSQCKYISMSSDKPDGTDYFKKSDRFPLPVKSDSYYRVVTVSKDGITKVYPATLMPSLDLKGKE